MMRALRGVWLILFFLAALWAPSFSLAAGTPEPGFNSGGGEPAEWSGTRQGDELPLGLSLNRGNIAEIKAWYAEGKGEAAKFHFKDPERF